MGRKVREEVDLGIAIAHALTKPGQIRTSREIAAYANCLPQNIEQIEAKALRKLRVRFGKQLLEHLYELRVRLSGRGDAAKAWRLED